MAFLERCVGLAADLGLRTPGEAGYISSTTVSSRTNHTEGGSRPKNYIDGRRIKTFEQVLYRSIRHLKNDSNPK